MIDPIFSALVNAWWQGLVLTALVWLVLRDSPRLSASTRLAIWQVTLAVVLLLPMLQQLPVLEWFEAPAAPRPVATAPPVVTAPSLEVESAPAPVVELPSEGLVPGLASTIVLLAILQLLRLAVGYWMVRRLKRQSMASDLAVPMALSRQAAVRISTRAAMPMAVGFRRPMILLPQALVETLTAEELEYILLHEAAHLERRDDWVGLAERVVRAIFFFHPAVYWIGRQLDLEREMACDDWVVARAGALKPYAEALVRVAELGSAGRAPLLAAGAGSRFQIFRRLESLLDSTRNRMPSASSPLVLLAGLLLVVVVSQSKPFGFLFGFADYSHTSRMTSDVGSREFKTRGEIRYTPNEDDVESMEPGAKLVVSVGDRWTVRSVEVEPNAQGQLERRYFSSGVRQTYGLDAQRLLARELAAWRRDSETDLPERLARWIKDKGVEGTLREIRQVSAYAAKRRYLEGLVEQPGLSEEDARRAIRMAAEIDSDGEKQRFFEETHTRLLARGLDVPLLGLIDSIHSDGTRRAILIGAMDSFAPAAMPRVFRSVAEIQSDGDKSATLVEAVGRPGLSLSSEFYAAAGAIHSDGDRRRVIEMVLERLGEQPGVVAAALGVARTIQSDGDKAKLITTASTRSLDAAGFSAAVAVLRTIHSNGERAQGALALLPAASSLPGAMAELLATVGEIDSNGDRARVLSEAGKVFVEQEPIRRAYFAAVNGLTSSADHRRVLTELLQRPGLQPETLVEVGRSAARISSEGDAGAVLRELALLKSGTASR